MSVAVFFRICSTFPGASVSPPFARSRLPNCGDDERRDADRVRGGHRGALDPLVQGARPVGAVTHERDGARFVPATAFAGHVVSPFGTPAASTSPHAWATFSGYAFRMRFCGALNCGVPKKTRLSPPGAATSVCSTP